jgi:hypothetical protein
MSSHLTEEKAVVVGTVAEAEKAMVHLDVEANLAGDMAVATTGTQLLLTLKV